MVDSRYFCLPVAVSGMPPLSVVSKAQPYIRASTTVKPLVDHREGTIAMLASDCKMARFRLHKAMLGRLIADRQQGVLQIAHKLTKLIFENADRLQYANASPENRARYALLPDRPPKCLFRYHAPCRYGFFLARAFFCDGSIHTDHMTFCRYIRCQPVNRQILYKPLSIIRHE